VAIELVPPVVDRQAAEALPAQRSLTRRSPVTTLTPTAIGHWFSSASSQCHDSSPIRLRYQLPSPC
jgi:hypothetical protein